MVIRLSSSLAMIALIGAAAIPEIAVAQCSRWAPFSNYRLEQSNRAIVSLTNIAHSNSAGRHPAQHFSGNARVGDSLGRVSGTLAPSGNLQFTITWDRHFSGRHIVPNHPIVGTYSAFVMRSGVVTNGRASGGGQTAFWFGSSIPCLR